ncbi:hypothetical protein AB0G04_17600 [Actinoplanes sp. NPDC023801]|uniref:hypothetical protein n=1 Tax=Actinoplanes sp. NPDC023801 TaxID=3154595 RepID=UPI0033D6BE2D
MRTSVKRAVIVGTALAVTVGAGAAYAAWTANGTGTVSAKAGTSQGVTGTAVTVDGVLYPGGKADAKISITNPNQFPVMVTQIAPNGTVTVAGAGCTAVNSAVALATKSLTQYIGAGDSVVVTLTDAVTMGDSSDNSCQDATFTFPVSLTATSTPKQP